MPGRNTSENLPLVLECQHQALDKFPDDIEAPNLVLNSTINSMPDGHQHALIPAGGERPVNSARSWIMDVRKSVSKQIWKRQPSDDRRWR